MHPTPREPTPAVRTYFDSGGNTTEAAVCLHVHRNNVRYHLQRAEDVRGRPLSDDRLHLEVSLLACERLARAVLREPPD